MARLLAALFGASLVATAALRNRQALDSDVKLSDWKYFPPNATIGIVTGAYPEAFSKGGFAVQTASLMFKYAQKHGYAFYVEKNMSRITPRKKYWNKVILMHKLLREVPYLVWMDPEIIVQGLKTPMEELMSTAKCDGAEQKQWEKYLPKKQNNETFLWLNSDRSPYRYVFNANTGMVILKKSPEAFALLQAVWNVGNDPEAYKRHKDELHWLRKNESNPDHGWPFEQGAFWDVMVHDPAIWMPKACIAEKSHFHSVRPYLAQDKDFAVSFYGAPHLATHEQAHKVLRANHIKAQLF